MPTILTIAGVDYDRVDRPANRIQMQAVDLQMDGGYDTCEFIEVGGHPLPSFHGGQPVEVTWVDDEDVEHLYFSGTLTDPSHDKTRDGWIISYRALSRRHACEHVPVTGHDRTGVMVFNRSPEDPYYVDSEAGLELGEILRLVLSVEATAVALDALGIGDYDDLDPPTLPASTLADLALLDIVPRQPVQFYGEGLVAQIEQVVQHWMPRFVLRIRPDDGSFRLIDTSNVGVSGALVPATIILPNATVAAHPVEGPSIRTSTERCATRVVVRGSAEVEVAVLSEEDGTLAEVWSPTEESNWTYADFTTPKDAYSEGSVASMTGNSAVVDPTDATRAWASNFWSGRQAWIQLFNPVATGLTMIESRRVTSNTSLSAGGTSTITWDASWPADSPSYTKYRLIGGASGLAEVGRLYEVREPDTGDVGLATWIGAHLVRRSELPVRVANNSGFIEVHYPMGIICQKGAGEPPEMEMPLNLEVIPTQGRFRFFQPVVSVFGDPVDLEQGYPTTEEGGLPGDVRVVAMYSRGTLEAVYPPNTGAGLDVPAYAGTAYTQDGWAVTKVIDMPAWTNRGDFAQMLALAQEHHGVLKDKVHEGTFDWYGLPPWDWWEFSTAVNFSVPPLTGLWEDINAPIRSVRITWPSQEGMLHKLTVGFGNRRRPHSGDDLYVPAQFTRAGLNTRVDDMSGAWGVGRVKGIDSGERWVGNAAALGVSAMNAVANAGLGAMNAVGREGVSAMNEGAKRGIAGMNDVTNTNIENTLNGTPGGPQQIDPVLAHPLGELGTAAEGVAQAFGRAGDLVAGIPPANAPRQPRRNDPRPNPRHDAIQANQERANRKFDRQLPMPLKPHVNEAAPLRKREPGEPIAPGRTRQVPANANPRRDAIEANRLHAQGRMDAGVKAPEPQKLEPHVPTPEQAEQIERGRAERRRLHPEEE